MAWAIVYVAAFVVLTSFPLLVLHSAAHGFSLLQASLAVFCAINTLICIWEIGLYINRKLIAAQYDGFRKRLQDHELPSPMFMFSNVSLGEALTLKYWALVWSTYSLFDPSYSDQTSFGFTVDVGNGYTTLVPSVLFALCMTWPLLPARIIGIMGFVKFYQECYGTFLYFFAFLLNKRSQGKHLVHILTVVLIPNMIWVIFPMIGIYASYHLIESNSYDLFR